MKNFKCKKSESLNFKFKKIKLTDFKKFAIKNLNPDKLQSE